MRLFVALNFAEELRAELHRATAALREAGMPVRWVDVALYHVTLKFIGEVPDGRRDAMAEAVLRTAEPYRPFEVTLGGVGAFPSLRRPRVIWVGVETTPELRSIKHDLEEVFASLGVERESRAFHPHVTVGRVRDEATAGDLRPLEELAEEIEFEARARVDSIDLMRSRLRPSGPEYSVEEEATLAAGG